MTTIALQYRDTLPKMDTNDYLNIFEQRPCWERLVTNTALCFELTETANTTAIVESLQDALDRLTNSFPWLAGQVINEGRNLQEGNSGIFRIVPRSDRPQIIVKDHKQTPSVPSIQSLKQSGYAVAMLDESIFAPRPAVKMIPAKEKAVLLIQANFLSGGLVLVFSGDHAAMDGPGQYQVMQWFCKACHGEAFTPSDLEVGNMSRRNMIPLLDSTYEQGAELSPLIPPTSPPGLQSPRAPSTWATFQIPAQAVAEIKATATATSTSAYISTDDSLSAFIWQSIARARLQRLPPTTPSTASRAINVRKTLGVPPSYPGLVQNNLFHALTLSQISTSPLGAIASLFRETLTRCSPSLGFYTRALATALSRSTDKNAFRVTANMDLSLDLIISSSTTSDLYDLNFPLSLGQPEAVRITQQPPFEGIAYLLPMARDGDATIVLCLRDGDLAALGADEEFRRYARHVG